jgi:hypothetical protein
VETVLQKRQDWEGSIAMNDELSPEDIENQKKYLTELLANVAKNCLLNIRDIPTLIRLATVHLTLICRNILSIYYIYKR